ncbi:hypothetical protein NDU88_005466 [Pleurodeles waltl]|uniref:Uncharacterized protein n=1 Tax=Pleurodeles waltl TaxID=8319 RepID=A0AAV7QH97_PLEWA|nr:hypothetical protein NDU88_005466 [Pleurodeles waltl]
MLFSSPRGPGPLVPTGPSQEHRSPGSYRRGSHRPPRPLRQNNSRVPRLMGPRERHSPPPARRAPNSESRASHHRAPRVTTGRPQSLEYPACAPGSRARQRRLDTLAKYAGGPADDQRVSLPSPTGSGKVSLVDGPGLGHRSPDN